MKQLLLDLRDAVKYWKRETLAADGDLKRPELFMQELWMLLPWRIRGCRVSWKLLGGRIKGCRVSWKPLSISMKIGGMSPLCKVRWWVYWRQGLSWKPGL